MIPARIRHSSASRADEARAGSAESLWPASRPSRAPRASPSPHARLRHLHIWNAQDEMKFLRRSPLKAAGDEAKIGFGDRQNVKCKVKQ